MPWGYLAGSLALLAAGLFSLYFGLKRARLARAVAAAPTQKVRSVAMGKAELKGLAQPFEQALCAPFSGSACVWFRFLVEEEQRTVDSKGRSRTHWVSIANGLSAAPFRVDDGTGQLQVDPAGAEVDAPKTLSYTTGGLWAGSKPLGPRVAEFAGAGGILGAVFGRRRRLSEWRIDLQRPLYVLGILRPRRLEPGADPVAVLGQGELGEAFLISTKDEAQILSRLRWASFGLWFLGLLLGLASAYVARRGQLI